MTGAAFRARISTEPCPDCDAHLALIQHGNVLAVAIHHDDTCPQRTGATR